MKVVLVVKMFVSELYWFTVLGNLNILGTAAIIVGFTNIVIGLMIYGDCNSCKKLFKFSCVGIGLGVLLLIFIPRKSELYMIYGVGSTIDYIKDNPTAKQLPDKYFKIIDKWADEQLK